MPRSHDTALEQTEGRLYRVGRYAHSLFISHVLLGLVVYGLVLAAILRSVEVVDGRFVRHDNVNSFINIAVDDVINRLVVDLVRMDEVQVTAALSNANYWSLIAPALGTLRLSADVHLVNFDRPCEFVVSLSHCGPDTMTEIPCGLIADSQRALDLVSRHSLAALAEQVGAEKPLPEVQMGIVEDRCGSDRELVMA